MMSAITVYINGEAKEIPAHTNLADLVKNIQLDMQMEDDPKSIATAVNEIFVPRSAREKYELKHNDQVMTFSPITGG
ncbi:sulfur carrier protein ThiS [Pelistega suis]|nr:sulfur carrier protein ThiS [Pelistega suis]MCQ9329648.1 sulfur carrier protein ThiS [Pelistega suis]